MDTVVAESAIKILDGTLAPKEFNGFRHGVNYPTALSFALVGPSFASLMLYPFLCSVGSLILAYAIGARIGGVRVGLGAVFVLAVLPLDIILAGQAWTDGPQAFFSSLALWLLLVAQNQERTRRSMLGGFGCGVAFGFSCVVKVTTLLLVPALCIYALLERNARRPLCAALLALGLVFVGEMVLDYSLTGDAMGRVKSVTDRDLFSFSDQTYGYSVTGFHIYPKRFFVQPLYYGLHMYAAVGAIGFAGFRHRRRCLLLLLWTLWFFGYTWLGPVSLTSYSRLSQFARYLAVINVPLAVLIAIWFAQLKIRIRWLAYVVLGAAGLFMANLNVGDLSERAIAVQLAAQYLDERADAFPVYVNLHTDRVLRLFLGQDPNREIIVYGRTAQGDGGLLEELASAENAYILFDRNHVQELLKRFPDQQYPTEIFSPPPHWEEVLVVNNPGRKSSYAQLRLLRWVAHVPFAPHELSQKVIETIDKTLQERDLVLYFARPDSLRSTTP